MFIDCTALCRVFVAGGARIGLGCQEIFSTTAHTYYRSTYLPSTEKMESLLPI